MQRLKSDRSRSRPQLNETFHALVQSIASGLGDGGDQTGPRTTRLQSQLSIADLLDMPFGFQVTRGGSLLMTLNPTNLSNART